MPARTAEHWAGSSEGRALGRHEGLSTGPAATAEASVATRDRLAAVACGLRAPTSCESALRRAASRESEQCEACERCSGNRWGTGRVSG